MCGSWCADECANGASATVLRVTVVQTVLIYVLIPAAVYGLIALLTLWPKSARTPRYRPGQEWTYAPVWWVANPAGVGSGHGGHSGADDEAIAPTDETAQTARGGARGNW